MAEVLTFHTLTPDSLLHLVTPQPSNDTYRKTATILTAAVRKSLRRTERSAEHPSEPEEMRGGRARQNSVEGPPRPRWRRHYETQGRRHGRRMIPNVSQHVPNAIESVTGVHASSSHTC